MTALVDTMRAFVALNLDVASTREIAAAAIRLRAGSLAPKARWLAPTKLHVTLKFFGQIDVGLAPPVCHVLEELAESRVPPRLAIPRLSAFPSPDRARVIIAEVADEEGALAQLANAVDAAGEKLGFSREDREFRPHVTLARTLGALDASAWLASVAINVTDVVGTELVLYRSDLARKGAEYVAVGRFAFTGAPGPS